MDENNNLSAFERLQELIKTNRDWLESTTSTLKELEQVANITSSALSEIQEKLNLERFKIISSIDMSSLKFQKAIEIDTQLLTSAALAYQTPEISELIKGITSNNAMNAFSQFSQCLQLPQISASNLSLLKLNPSLQESITQWNGMSSFVKEMNSQTAKTLLDSVDVYVDTKKKLYISKKDNECSAKQDEMNVLASSMSLFQDITASELMSLNDILDTDIEFALTNPTAQRIHQIIQQWTDFLDFDCEKFYRARVLEENQAPYTTNSFGTAPEKYVGYGRYNREGQCHYYVASSESGACSEIRKHRKKTTLQVATLIPIKEVRLIDLSQQIGGCTFLDYLRFDADDNERVPRAYLLPCYVASCCKRSRIEGIKYYGSKKYNNYVTWNSSYYSVIEVSAPQKPNKNL